MSEEATDTEFYVVVFEDKEYKVHSHVFVHLRNGETIFNYMQRKYDVGVEQVNQIYKRTFVKQ